MFIMPPYSIAKQISQFALGRPKDDYLIARKAGEVPFGIYAAQEYLECYTRKKTMNGLALKLVEFKDKNSKS
ncbi:hypothetical protein AM416_003923 [Acinetobacter baumannii]|nr:hypothetical protein AM416_003923 [Acinetobacter baumannii]